ncbi:MAG: hypothetical protein WAN43_05515 [Rhodomicrobium sp.]
MKKALLLLFVFLPCALSSPAWPESTGGSIGKQDKSISGSDETAPSPEPKGPAFKKRQPSVRESAPTELPQSIRLHVTSIWGDFRGTFHNTGGNHYQGSWNHGLRSSMTVTLTASTIVIDIRDTGGYVNLCSGRATGSRSGRSASGAYPHSCQIGGGTANFDASW